MLQERFRLIYHCQIMMTNMLKKVLLVDDDSVTLSLCDMVIKRFTFAEEVDKAQNGQEAIDYFNDIVDDSNNSNISVPAIIFLDLNMPVMNGWDFLDEFIRKGFNKLFPETRIIVLSSSIDPRDIQRASHYDIIIEFISKPLTLKVIKEIKQHAALVPHFS